MNPEIDQTNWAMLPAYFAGSVTAEERDAIDRWLHADPDRAILAEKFRLLDQARCSPSLPSYDLESSKAAVAKAIRSAVPSSRYQDNTFRPTRAKVAGKYWIAYSVAASVAIAALIAFGMGRGTYAGRPALLAQPFTYATAKGERATVTLPDGSSVMLNVASRLEVPSDYAAGNRVITLDGEARFTVVHQTGAPFTVLAGPSTTRVLGTTFFVRHYAGDTSAVIAVEDGKVAVQSSVLVAQQQIEVGPSDVSTVHTRIPGTFSVGTGVLTLDDMPLAAAIVPLSRWYNVDIELGDTELNSNRIAGRFTAGSLGDLATVLEWTFNIRVVRDGNTLTLYRK